MPVRDQKHAAVKAAYELGSLVQCGEFTAEPVKGESTVILHGDDTVEIDRPRDYVKDDVEYEVEGQSYPVGVKVRAPDTE